MRCAGFRAVAAVAVLSAPCGLRAQEMASHADHAPARPDGPDQPQGTDQSPGSMDAPVVAHDRAADRYWAPAAMERAEMAMMAAHAATRYSAMKVDLAEYQLGKGGDGYRWEGEGWTGDMNRLLLRTRGEAQVGQRLDQAEIEVAYSRAISPWWNLQVGLRQDVRPTPARTHAMLALEGLAPYRFDLLAAAYISDRGEMTARFEASVDQRITRRWVLQPRAEIDLSAQDLPAARMGAGLVGAEIGLRLRYEISRKFAPYVGLSWSWAAGRSADYARAQGNSAATRAVVLGLKSWF